MWKNGGGTTEGESGVRVGHTGEAGEHSPDDLSSL